MGSSEPKESGGGGGGASRKKRPTREEMTAIRAPGQRNQAGGRSVPGRPGRIVSVESYNERPKEPGGVDDRAPVKSAPQRAYESIQELRGRREKTMPGMLGAMSRISLDSQIKKLQEGGTPVMSGTMTVGVISKGGSYTGRSEFADLARSQYRTAGAEIRAPIGVRSSRSDGGSERATTPAAAPSQSTPKIALPTTGGDTGDAQRRAMLSGGAGAASRRKYINR